jgi:hypothetical protein
LSAKRKFRQKKRNGSSSGANSDRSPNQTSDSTENNEDLAYMDTLPEVGQFHLFLNKINYLVVPFLARQTGRSNVQYLGHEIQSTRLGQNAACQSRTGDLQDVFASSTTTSNYPIYHGASR